MGAHEMQGSGKVRRAEGRAPPPPRSGRIWEVRLAMDSGEREGMSLSLCATGWMTESPPSRHPVDTVFAGLVTLATVLGKSMCLRLGASGGQGGLWGLTAVCRRRAVSRGEKPG